MKTIYSRTKHFIKTRKWLSAGIAVLIIVVLYFIFGRSKPTQVDTVPVVKQTIVEEVSTTGNIKPLSDIDLAFEIGGRVSNISVAVGDKVYQGQYLASVSNGELAAAVEQAQAGLKIAQANLATLQNGSTPQSLAVTQSQVEKSKNDLVNAMQDAYTKADDAIRNYADIMFNSPQTKQATLNFQTDPQLQNNINNTRPIIGDILNSWNNSINTLSTDQAAVVVSNNLDIIKKFLDNVALATNTLAPYSTISQTTINTWKANISIARANIAAATTAYKSALSTFNINQNQLVLAKAPATSEQLQAQQALVEQAQASLAGAQAQLAKSIIRSPINGVVTNIIPRVGETISPGVKAVSVISYGEYEIESLVPEADIAKLVIGDIATTTLDAYGSDVIFKTQIIKIDPAETVVEGVPTYKVTLRFISKDDRIKSGMTANLDILTNTRPNVLSVPTRSVYTSDNRRFVKIVDSMNNNKITEIEVKTGIRGINGYVEVISGLKLGDKIVASPNI